MDVANFELGFPVQNGLARSSCRQLQNSLGRKSGHRCDCSTTERRGTDCGKPAFERDIETGMEVCKQSEGGTVGTEAEDECC